MSLLGIFATYVTCQSRFPFCRLRYLCRFGPTAICHTICTVPCINRYKLHSWKKKVVKTIHCTKTGSDVFYFFFRVIMTQHPSLLEGLNFASTDHEVCHLGDNYLHSFFFQTCSYVAAIGFVATRFPEKWFPGIFMILLFCGNRLIELCCKTLHLCKLVLIYSSVVTTDSVIKGESCERGIEINNCTGL